MPASGRTDRVTVAESQASRLSQLLHRIYGRNPFYTRKLDAAGLRPDALTSRAISSGPFTNKHELGWVRNVCPLGHESHRTHRAHTLHQISRAGRN